ncbi:MAG: MotA/TolQ/ExbB proton channel family protein [Bacteriovoracaceae bacterium]|nr:MotA/TolQ/ExbB proton channel family protein [Bacteriovoracaceae bacterium]
MRLIDYVNQGGSITWILVAMNVIGLSLVLWRFWVLWDFRKNLSSKADSLIAELLAGPSKGADALSLAKDFIAAKVSELEYGMIMIRVIATIAPLLGLLGTVVGIFEAFQVIASKGLDNPGDFASGISLALITTIAGLIVAIPHYIAHNLLTGQLDKLEISLERIMLPKISGK